MEDKHNQLTINNLKLSLKQKLFSQFYIETFGNGTESVIKSGYDVKDKTGNVNRNLAKSIASENLTKPDILTYINHLIDKSGMSDEFVAVQHLYLISQNNDLGVKTRAIDMYYKLRGKYKQSESQYDEYNETLNEVVRHVRTLLPK